MCRFPENGCFDNEWINFPGDPDCRDGRCQSSRDRFINFDFKMSKNWIETTGVGDLLTNLQNQLNKSKKIKKRFKKR